MIDAFPFLFFFSSVPVRLFQISIVIGAKKRNLFFSRVTSLGGARRNKVGMDKELLGSTDWESNIVRVILIIIIIIIRFHRTVTGRLLWKKVGSSATLKISPIL